MIQDSHGYIYDDEPESDAEFRRRWRKRQGWRRCFWLDFNAFFERICCRYLARCHRNRKLAEFPSPWWFRLASKIEFWSRLDHTPMPRNRKAKP